MRKLNTHFEQIPLDAVRAAIEAANAVNHRQDANVIFEPSSAKTEPYSVPDSARPRPRRRKVLLVDPDVATRSMHAEHLRGLTYDVEEAEDGLEALAKAIANQPTIVVTKSPLTGISGAELCRMLRSEPLTRAVPVIVLGATDGASASTVGPDAVRVKPLTPEDLASEIHALLATASTRELETSTDG